MKNNKFRGWKDVFSFTFLQSVKKGGFRAVTLIVALLLAAGIALIVVVTAKPDEEAVKSEIQDVYVNDPYGTDYAAWMAILGQDAFDEVSFIPVQERSEAMEEAAAAERFSYVIVEVAWEEGVFQMEAVLPENTTVRESEAEELLSAMSSCFESGKLFLAGLSEEQLIGVAAPIVTDFSKIGENHTFGMVIVRMLAPMIFGLVIYMMLLLYGQSVSREVSVEKTSKLTETLLTSVRPYALISGKVLAVSAVAILQFFFWVLAAVAGLLIGNAAAASMYPGYENAVLTMFEYIRDNVGASAFSPMAVVLAVLTFVVGFVFYCILAGMAGCLVSKPEDVAQTQSLFQFPVIISFFACYFGIILEKAGLLTACRLIPFTIPFCVPVDVLTGSISVLQGVIAFVIQIVFAVILVIVSGKMYEGLILYSGQKLNIKTALHIITAKK